MRGRELIVNAGLGIAALSAGLIFARNDNDAYDTFIMSQVAHSMATGHGFVVPPQADAFHFNSPYASYGLGMSVLMVPSFWLGPMLHRTPRSIYMLINTVVFAAIIVVLYWRCRAAGATSKKAAVTALLVGFTTPLLAYAPTGLSELGVAFGIAVGMLGIVRRSSLLSGIGATIAILMRPDSVILVAPILGVASWMVAGRKGQAALLFIVGLGPGLLVTAAYNALRFGSPLHFGYRGYLVFNHPLIAGLYGLTMSPARGIVLYAPVLIVAVAAVAWAWRQSPVLVVTAATLLVVRLVFYAPYHAWYGGVSWGPRYLVPSMPVLAVGLLEVVNRFRSLPIPAKAAVLLISVVSLGIQVSGAVVSPASEHLWDALAKAPIRYAPNYSDFEQVATSRTAEIITDNYMFDWRYFPISNAASELVHRRNLAGRYLAPVFRVRIVSGLLILIVFGLLLTLRGSSLVDKCSRQSRGLLPRA